MNNHDNYFRRRRVENSVYHVSTRKRETIRASGKSLPCWSDPRSKIAQEKYIVLRKLTFFLISLRNFHIVLVLGDLPIWLFKIVYHFVFDVTKDVRSRKSVTPLHRINAPVWVGEKFYFIFLCKNSIWTSNEFTVKLHFKNYLHKFFCSHISEGRSVRPKT